MQPVAGRQAGPVAASIALLVLTNLLDNVWLPGAQAFTHVAVAGVLWWIARRDGLTWHDLGLAARDSRRGGVWAGFILFGVAVGYAVALAIPATRDFFTDDKAAGLTVAGLAFQVAVRIPLETVLFEEFAFRGVLWAQFRARWGTLAATVGSSLLFGVWHVLPSLGLGERNVGLGESVGDAGAVLLAVAVTTAAGVVFCELRRRSGSLLPPIALHWAVNGLGLIAAWWVLR